MISKEELCCLLQNMEEDGGKIRFFEYGGKVPPPRWSGLCSLDTSNCVGAACADLSHFHVKGRLKQFSHW